jgi:hypothetical protein
MPNYYEQHGGDAGSRGNRNAPVGMVYGDNRQQTQGQTSAGGSQYGSSLQESVGSAYTAIAPPQPDAMGLFDVITQPSSSIDTQLDHVHPRNVQAEYSTFPMYNPVKRADLDVMPLPQVTNSSEFDTAPIPMVANSSEFDTSQLSRITNTSEFISTTTPRITSPNEFDVSNIPAAINQSSLDDKGIIYPPPHSEMEFADTMASVFKSHLEETDFVDDLQQVFDEGSEGMTSTISDEPLTDEKQMSDFRASNKGTGWFSQ